MSLTYQQAVKLGQRAVAAGWRWVPEALDVLANSHGDSRYREGAGDFGWYSSHRYPDFRDAATRGILLEQVRERLSDPKAYVRSIGDRWFVNSEKIDPVRELFAPWEAEALVAVLEASPS